MDTSGAVATEPAPGGETGARTLPPFNAAYLDELLGEAGIDILIASSKHNIQYLLGGYRFFFFDYTDAIGVSRYLPLVIYFRGRPEQTVYVGATMERWEKELGRFWMETVETGPWDIERAVDLAAKHLSRAKGKIGIERDFLPAAAEAALRRAVPDAEFVEGRFPLERLRARKSRGELDLIRKASELVVDSMLAAIGRSDPGMTKLDIVDALRREEVARGLVFEYCLIAAGTSRNRAPSAQIICEGDIVSLDSGGNYGGYIGDLCRMAIFGEPDSELEDMLAEIEVVQQAARQAIRPGAPGKAIFAAVEGPMRRSQYAQHFDFLAHGMGLVSHEAPRLSGGAPPRYPAYDAELPLEAGMVISVETAIGHPRRGFVKLEDTIAVTETGFEAFGDHGRGWNRAGV